jgi:hypothetical protein
VEDYSRRKGLSGYRPIHKFGVGDHARQLVLNAAVQPRLHLDPRQFAAQGGRPAAIRAAIEHVNLHGARWAVQVDITNFFPSIDREAAISRLSARAVPEEVSRGTIFPIAERLTLSEHTLVHFAYSTWMPTPSTLTAQAQQGIPQGGACSSIVAEIVVSEILSALPPSVLVVNYADNFLMMARTRRELEQVTRDLSAAVERPCQHPAGAFQLHQGPMRRISDGVEFLGYRLHHYQGLAYVEPTRDAKRKFARRFMALLADVARCRRNGTSRLRAYVRGWRNAYSAWRRVDRNIGSALFWGMFRLIPGLRRVAVDRMHLIM